MSKRTKKDKRPVAKIDFKPYGAAIKAGRTKQKESRNKAAVRCLFRRAISPTSRIRDSIPAYRYS